MPFFYRLVWPDNKTGLQPFQDLWNGFIIVGVEWGAQRAVSFQVVHQLKAMIVNIVVCGLDKTHYRYFKTPKLLTAHGRLFFLLWFLFGPN